MAGWAEAGEVKRFLDQAEGWVGGSEVPLRTLAREDAIMDLP